MTRSAARLVRYLPQEHTSLWWPVGRYEHLSYSHVAFTLASVLFLATEQVVGYKCTSARSRLGRFSGNFRCNVMFDGQVLEISLLAADLAPARVQDFTPDLYLYLWRPGKISKHAVLSTRTMWSWWKRKTSTRPPRQSFSGGLKRLCRRQARCQGIGLLLASSPSGECDDGSPTIQISL